MPWPFEGLAPCSELVPFAGSNITFPVGDGFAKGSGDAAHAYLDGARQAWEDESDYMDILDKDSPCYQLKQVEYGLYLDHWKPFLQGAEEVIDVGAGVGRFSVPLLRRGCSVHAVDADPLSLERLVWHAAGLPGSLNVQWTSVFDLPDVQVDLALAVEVLCYVPDTLGALKVLASRVRPGGHILLAMEGRWGWAASVDAPDAGVGHALVGDGELDLPGDRYVRTFDEAGLRQLIADAGLEVLSLRRSHYVYDGPLEHCTPDNLPLMQVLDLEQAARVHPVWQPLNRIWSCVLRRPVDAEAAER